MEFWRKKNTDTRVVFPIQKSDGTFITSAAGLDSEFALFGAHAAGAPSFGDCTHEATEIGTTGLYYLDVSAAELNDDYGSVIQVKSSSTGAVVQVLLFRTQVNDVNTTQVLGTAQTAGDLAAAIITNAAGTDIAADIIAIKAETAAIVADTGTDGVVLAADAITAAKIADNAIAAEHIADGAIDNATFAADVGSTALATNIIAKAAEKAIGVAGASLTGTGIPAATVTALGTGSALTALATQASVNTIDDFLDTEVAAIYGAVITNAAGTDVAADIIALKTVADTIATDTTTDIPTTITLALKLLRNKVVTDPATGVMTVYDDNGSTPLYTANVYEDVAGTVPFDGSGANRRDRLV